MPGGKRTPGYPWQRRQTRRVRMQRKRREAETVRRARAQYRRRFTLSQLPPSPRQESLRVYTSSHREFHLYPGDTQEVTVRVPEDGILFGVTVQTALGSVQGLSLALPGVQRLDPTGEWFVIRPDYAPIPLGPFGGASREFLVPVNLHLPILAGDRIRVTVACTSLEDAQHLQVALTYQPYSLGGS